MLLVQITESDYSTIVKEFVKQPFENEHSQLVRWLSLLRKFFHSRQISHNHGAKQEKEKGLFYSHTIGNKKGKKLLASAKLSESFDNLSSNKKVCNIMSSFIVMKQCFNKLIWRTIDPKSFLFGTAQFSLWARWVQLIMIILSLTASTR